MTKDDIIRIARSVFAYYDRTNDEISWEDRNEAFEAIIKALGRKEGRRMKYIAIINTDEPFTEHAIQYIKDTAFCGDEQAPYGFEIEDIKYKAECEDAISRQAVLDTIDKWVRNMHVLAALPANEVTPLFESMRELSSVTPQPKTGRFKPGTYTGMTKEKIKNTPELVDFLLDKSVTADSREKLRKRLEEVCNMAIKALEQEPLLDKIKAEIDRQYKWLINTRYTIRDVDIAFGSIFRIIDKYRSESEDKNE